MKRVKRILTMLLCLAACLSGCAKPVEEQKVEELRVTATFYPLYALCSMIVRDVPDLYLSCLVQPQDGDLRDYALSDWDLSLIAGADAVFCGGEGLESFADSLYALGENGPAVAPLLQNSTLADSVDRTPNPYIYMSIDGALSLLQNAHMCFATLDPRYAELYQKNHEAAKSVLESLREEIHAQADELKGKRVAVLHDALCYTAQDYDMEIVCDYQRKPGVNLSDDEMAHCLDALKEADPELVLIEKQAPESLVDALTDAGFIVVKLNTMTTIPANAGAQGYIDALRENADALRATEVRE